MSKNYKTIEVPATTRQQQVSMSCDFCGKETKSYSWDRAYYEVNETEVCVELKHKEGFHYPESGSGQEFQCDMCPTCFKEKLVPFLKTIAKTPLDYKDYDF